MIMNLTKEVKDTIKQSLEFSLMRIREYTEYPSYEFKQRRIIEIKEAQKWIKAQEAKTP